MSIYYSVPLLIVYTFICAVEYAISAECAVVATDVAITTTISLVIAIESLVPIASPEVANVHITNSWHNCKKYLNYNC